MTCSGKAVDKNDSIWGSFWPCQYNGLRRQQLRVVEGLQSGRPSQLAKGDVAQIGPPQPALLVPEVNRLAPNRSVSCPWVVSIRYRMRESRRAVAGSVSQNLDRNGVDRSPAAASRSI